MRNHQRSLFLTLGLAFILTSTFAGAGAFQQSGQPERAQKPKPAAQPTGQDNEPVAVTPREKPPEKPVARELEDGQFGTFGFPVINNKGDLVFLARFRLNSAPEGFGQGLFIKTAKGEWRVVRDGEKAVNLAEPLMGFHSPAFNDNGDLAFIGNFGNRATVQSVSGQGGDPQSVRNAGIFIKTAAGLKNVTQLDQDVPNMPSKFFGFSNPTMNSKGLLAFIGTYIDPDGRGLFMLENGKLTLVARSGQKIAAGDTAVFSEHYYPSTLNERGEIAWFSRISGGTGIFVKRATSIEAVAIQGKPSPISGASYIGFGQIPPSINDKGEVAFVGFYDGPNAGRALLFKGEGPVKVVAKTGDTAGDSGLAFTGFANPSLNNRGEIAFIATYGGRTRGVFLKTAKGFETVALYEQKVPGAAKEDQFNNFQQPSLNDRGEVVFLAQLKNASIGLFYYKSDTGLKPLALRGDKVPVLK